MPVQILPKGSIMDWNGNGITEHNRGEFSVEWEEFESSSRMVDATLRRFIIAKKRRFSTSWDLVPNLTARTVDGKWGADAMKSFYETQVQPFTLAVRPGNGAVQTYTVYISNFSYAWAKRAQGYDMINVSVTLEEV
jgi:hypothetical protein